MPTFEDRADAARIKVLVEALRSGPMPADDAGIVAFFESAAAAADAALQAFLDANRSTTWVEPENYYELRYGPFDPDAMAVGDWVQYGDDVSIDAFVGKLGGIDEAGEAIVVDCVDHRWIRKEKTCRAVALRPLTARTIYHLWRGRK